MSAEIFVVEDDALTASQLQQHIETMGFQFAGKAKRAEDALEQIKQTQPDLVLMDIRLNGAMDGIAAAALLRADSAVAVVYVTAYADKDLLARAKLTEPYGYLVKPFTMQSLEASITMALVRSEIERKEERIFEGMVKTITEMVKLHDPCIEAVQTCAAALAEAIATELALPAQEVQGIRLAAMLHAVGFTGVPFITLMTNASLQDSENALFQSYPATSWQLLSDIELPYPVPEMVYQHMERLDGSGFPRGLKDAAILPGSRVVAVACRVARLLAYRGYELPASVEATLEVLEQGSGTLFDAKVVDACVRLFQEKDYTISA